MVEEHLASQDMGSVLRALADSPGSDPPDFIHGFVSVSHLVQMQDSQM